MKKKKKDKKIDLEKSINDRKIKLPKKVGESIVVENKDGNIDVSKIKGTIK